MKNLTKLDQFILKQEFPQLSFTDDVDIERYFEFRSLHKQKEALHIYNTNLKQKYPDPAMRTLLMTYYRKRDPRFLVLLTQSLVRRAETVIGTIKKIISFFVLTVTPLKNDPVHVVIQVCEKVIHAIADDRFAAVRFAQKYVMYAERLRYYAEEMKDAAQLLHMYVTNTLSSVRQFQEMQRIHEQKKRHQKSVEQTCIFDFSKIVFTRQQILSISISEKITQPEDKVLAYTLKYWHTVHDRVFENTVLLYSKKYGTVHYRVFYAVKTGRLHGWKDEEILHAVSAEVSHGYYYSLTGDLYLQRVWKQIKKKFLLVAAGSGQQSTDPRCPLHKSGEVNGSKHTRDTASSATHKNGEVPITHAEAKQQIQKRNLLPDVKLQTDAVQNTGLHMPQHAVLKSLQNVMPNAAQDMPPLSVAALIKKSTGKGYSIYKDLFFKTIGSSIRTVLSKCAVQRVLLFGAALNEAEHIVYKFFEKSYDNPYIQWQGSTAQAAVLEKGFRLENLESIISLWAKQHT